MKKFTAVSGDQSLFDLVWADDRDLYIIRSKSGKTLGAYHTIVDWDGVDVIAERKPYVEKYVPKVGDEFKVRVSISKIGVEAPQDESIFKCIFIDEKENVWAHDKSNKVYGLQNDYCQFTKIDRSPNPVNMVVSTQIPRVGERFKIDREMDRTFKCSKISGGYVVTECGCEFAISLNEFNIVGEDKWIPRPGQNFKVVGYEQIFLCRNAVGLENPNGIVYATMGSFKVDKCEFKLP